MPLAACRMLVHTMHAQLANPCLVPPLTHSPTHSLAPTDVRLLALGRDDFTRLLGPLQSLLESQAVAYDTPTTKISKVRWCGAAAVLLVLSSWVLRIIHHQPCCCTGGAALDQRLTGILPGCRFAHMMRWPTPVLSGPQALKLEDLKHVACLGAGAFGKVTLVQVGTRLALFSWFSLPQGQCSVQPTHACCQRCTQRHLLELDTPPCLPACLQLQKWQAQCVPSPCTLPLQYDGKYYALKALSKAHVVQTWLQVGVQRSGM